MAQGGSAHGWAIYIQEGELRFATTNHGKRTVLRTGQNVRGEVAVNLHWKKSGELTIGVNHEQVAKEKPLKLLGQHPFDGLQVGRDANGQVGDYQGPFALKGTVTEAIIEIEP